MYEFQSGIKDIQYQSINNLRLKGNEHLVSVAYGI